jgi:hypothetical protein
LLELARQGGNKVSIKHLITLNGIMLLLVSTGLSAQTATAQTATLNGQLLAQDTMAALPEVAITAVELAKPIRVVQTTTGPNGQFTITAKAGVYYELCSAATGRYAETCRFSKPVIVNASSAPATVQITAPTGIKMRVRILDPSGLLSSVWSRPNPLLQVFAGNEITRVHFPLQLEQSSSISNAYEGTVVIPTSMEWNVAMNAVKAMLFDSNGNAYQSNAAIPRPSDNGDNEFLAVYTLRGN